MAASSSPDKDPLFFNKVAAACLIVALIFFGLPILINLIAGGGGGHGAKADGEHHADAANPGGFAVPVAVKLGSAPVVEKIDFGTLLANASAAGGKKSAGLCISCHTLDKGGATSTGPNLWNIVGRPIGSVEGFKYSGAMKEFGGNWTYESLDGLLKNSGSFMPGTAMNQRVSKDTKRANILAYLQTLSDAPVAFPAPIVATPEATLETGEIDPVADGHGVAPEPVDEPVPAH